MYLKKKTDGRFEKGFIFPLFLAEFERVILHFALVIFMLTRLNISSLIKFPRRDKRATDNGRNVLARSLVSCLTIRLGSGLFCSRCGLHYARRTRRARKEVRWSRARSRTAIAATKEKWQDWSSRLVDARWKHLSRMAISSVHPRSQKHLSPWRDP